MKHTKIISIFICTVLMLTGCTSVKSTSQESSAVPAFTDFSDNTTAEGSKNLNNTAQEQSGISTGNTSSTEEGTNKANNLHTPDVGTDTGNIAQTPDTDKNTGGTVQAPETSQLLSDELDEKLMKPGEHLIYYFEEENSDKCMSICTDESETYLVYRFGTWDDLELEYPSSTDDSWNNFTYMYYFRGGGEENSGLDLNYLQFNIGSYKYIIYDEYLSEADSKDAGIMIYDMTATRSSDNSEDRYMDFEPDYKLTIIKGGSDSIEGGLALLRGNDKIKTELL